MAAIALSSILLMGAVALVVVLPGVDLRPGLVVMFQINADVGSLPVDG